MEFWILFMVLHLKESLATNVSFAKFLQLVYPSVTERLMETKSKDSHAVDLKFTIFSLLVIRFCYLYGPRFWEW